MDKNWKSGGRTWKYNDATSPITSGLMLHYNWDYTRWLMAVVDKWKVDNGGKQYNSLVNTTTPRKIELYTLYLRLHMENTIYPLEFVIASLLIRRQYFMESRISSFVDIYNYLIRITMLRPLLHLPIKVYKA